MKRGLVFGLMACLLATPVLAGADAVLRKANKGDPAAQLEMGKQAMAWWPPRAAEAEMWLHKAAEGGSVEAEYQLGLLYANPRSDLANDGLALAWFRKAAAHGHGEAIAAVCSAYYYGRGAPNDAVNTLAACAPAAALSDPLGMAVMGEAYARGTGGTAIDGPKAMDYLTRADAAGIPLATRTLGIIYFEGKLTATDYGRSLVLFRRAMAKGDGDAAYWLARQYEGGLGTPAESEEASRLYMLSGQAGNAEAKAWLSAHPEVTEDWLQERRVGWFSDPRGTWTVKSKLADGTEIDVPVGDYMFGGISDNYPERAQEDEVEGTVLIDCHWNAAGDLDNCFILSETPRGYGFANAAIKSVTRPAPITRKAEWAKKVAGHSMRSTLKFLLS